MRQNRLLAIVTVCTAATLGFLSGCEDLGGTRPITQHDAELVWVGKVFSGGRQCTQDIYSPPDTKQLLIAAGIEVYATLIEPLVVCTACYVCPTYAALHAARIREEQVPLAETLGFYRIEEPPNRHSRP